MDPSLVMSLTSDYRAVNNELTNANDDSTYQVEDTSGGSLVLGTLGQEKETLAGLGGPGSSALSGGRALLGGEVRGQVLGLDSVLGEVEEALGEAEAPIVNKPR